VLVRCLQCGAKLALLRKLRSGEFCSDAHQKEYLQKQEELALARLIEVQQTSLRKPPPLKRKPERKRSQIPENAPAAAWLLPTEVELQNIPTLFERPAPDPYGFQFSMMWPQRELQRIARRLLPARLLVELSPRSVPGIPKAAPLVLESGIAFIIAIERTFRLTSRLAFAGSLEILAGSPLAGRPSCRSAELSMDSASVACALPRRALGVVADSRPAVLEGVQVPLPPVRDLERRLIRPAPQMEPAIPKAPWKRAFNLQPAGEKSGDGAWGVSQAPCEPGIEACLLRVAMPFPVAPSPAALSSEREMEAVGRNPSPLENTPIRRSGLRLCGRKVATLRSPANGNRRPIAWLEGSALVSVRYRLPKLAGGQPVCELSVAPRLPVPIPMAGSLPGAMSGVRAARISVQAGEPPRPFPPPRFLVAPPIRISRRQEFAPPMSPLRPMSLSPATVVPPGPSGTGARPDSETPDRDRNSFALSLPASPALVNGRAAGPPCDLQPLLASAVAGSPAVRPMAAESSLLEAAAVVPVLPERGFPVRSNWTEAKPARLFPIGGIEKLVPPDSNKTPKSVLEIERPYPRPILPRAPRTVPLQARAFPDAQESVWRSIRVAGGIWSGIPRVVKLSGAVIAIIVAVVLGWGAGGPATSTVAASAGGASLFSGTLKSLQDGILRRAAVSLTDDFRLGLSEWEGQGDWANEWSYDTAGFVRIGSLALLTPSMSLTDYRMEFLGQIERRSMAWVVRAADYRNYHVVKIVITKPGPLPAASVFRYAVINGKEQKVTEVPLRLPLRGDTLYRVNTEVRGDFFTLAVQGQLIDTWTEPRLRRGGVGFFSMNPDRARLRWVGVWHQYDTLGRLCAYLAPLSMSAKERTINQ